MWIWYWYQCMSFVVQSILFVSWFFHLTCLRVTFMFLSVSFLFPISCFMSESDLSVSECFVSISHFMFHVWELLSCFWVFRFYFPFDVSCLRVTFMFLSVSFLFTISCFISESYFHVSECFVSISHFMFHVWELLSCFWVTCYYFVSAGKCFRSSADDVSYDCHFSSCFLVRIQSFKWKRQHTFVIQIWLKLILYIW